MLGLESQRILMTPGVLFATLWRTFGASWDPLAQYDDYAVRSMHFMWILSLSWGFWSLLGASWGLVGSSWDPLGGDLGPLGASELMLGP